MVDDNLILADAIGDVLQKFGYGVTIATTGKEALETAHQNLSLIVLDKNLPDLTGEYLRSELINKIPDVKIFCIGQNWTQSNLSTICYLEKPFTLKTFEDKLQKFLSFDYEPFNTNVT